MTVLLQSSDIDRFKWNACVLNSNDPLFYFLYEVIEAATNGKWSGIQVFDYGNIFPLVKGAKYGVDYYYTPMWIQRWGWLKPTNFSLPDVLAAATWVDVYVQNIKTDNLLTCTNYLLDLESDKKFSNNNARNIKKAINNGFKVSVSNVGIPDFVNFFKLNKGDSIKNLNLKHYQTLIKILECLSQKGILHSMQVANDNEVAAYGMFVAFGKRFTYFKGCVGKNAQGSGAGHLLLDFAIDFAKNNGFKWFDFYGGNSFGMAQYYGGFGAKPEIYYHFQKYRYPKLFKMVKKIGL